MATHCIKRLAGERISLREEDLLLPSNANANELLYVGEGHSATVYKFTSKQSVLKVYKKGYIHECERECTVYRQLNGLQIPHMLVLEKEGVDYIQVPFIEGETLYAKFLNGKSIERRWVDQVNETVEKLLAYGIYPNDLHLKNIMIEEKTGNLYIIDVARFSNHQEDHRWETLNSLYQTTYPFLQKHHKLTHPKLIELIIKLYKFCEKHAFFKSPKRRKRKH